MTPSSTPAIAAPARTVRAGSSSWWEGLATAAARYRDQHGNLDVPPRYVDPDTGFRLGGWIRNQQILWRRGRLSNERIVALENLGIAWELRDHPGPAERLSEAKSYFDKHGDLCVPTRSPGLGQWLKYSRSRLKAGTLPVEIAEQLDAIDPTWKHPRRLRGDVQRRAARRAGRLVEARRYFDKHGNLNVPTRSPGLGTWLKDVKSRFKDGVLPVEVAEQLDAIDPTWKDPRGQRVDVHERLVEARNYFDKHGDLCVPTRSPGLGQWLKTSRSRLKAGTLPEEIAEQLDAIDPTWKDPRGQRVDVHERLVEARNYYDEHGDLNVPAQSSGLGPWLRDVKFRFNAGTLPVEIAEQLDAIDPTWKDRRLQRVDLHERINEANNYFDEHGDLNVPTRSPGLGQWLKYSRSRLKAGTLPVEIAEQLDAIDPTWKDPRRPH